MLSVIKAKWRKVYLYAECRHAECRYAECRYAECYHAECVANFFQCRRNWQKFFLPNKLDIQVRLS
jgi:hypothetical protein